MRKYVCDELVRVANLEIDDHPVKDQDNQENYEPPRVDQGWRESPSVQPSHPSTTDQLTAMLLNAKADVKDRLKKPTSTPNGIGDRLPLRSRLD